MKKNDDRSFRVVIDKRIVKAFDALPETFTIKQLLETANIPVEEQKSLYDVLERMVSYGLIHKSKEKAEWYKDYLYREKKFKKQVELSGFELWLLDYHKNL